MDRSGRTVTIVCTLLALVCFGANSVLCRLALRETAIDPATFTTIRVTSGAVMLLLVGWFTELAPASAAPSWTSALILVLYAIPFSFAYVGLSAGTGALLLFGFVQVTMLAGAWRLGERFHVAQWLGLAVAAVGLIYLVTPTLTTPAWDAAVAMAIAGFGWGLYSLRGRGSANPLAQTRANFVRSVPLVMLFSAATFWRAHVDLRGALLAVTSGAIASGLGYVFWYTALRGLTAFRASIVQFAAPVLTATGGVIFLGETISTRLLVSGALVIGGLVLALPNRAPVSR
jgi:drug/metabolite transporter (DMT)-like permease